MSRVQNDPVRPGEQWFFYWKTSAALWESRILQSPAHEVIFIPINWGFHAEGPSEWDFGKIHPERDLLRLSQLLTQHNRRFCWLLPVTPAPFLPNGGVPVNAARTLSVSLEGVHLAALDQESKLNKIYSFFEPKVFQSFVAFMQAFAEFLAQHRVNAPVWGTSFHYQEEGKNISYLADCSVAFEQGFSRFLKQNFRDGVDLTSPGEEEKLKVRFTREVEDLFRTSAETVLTPFWTGHQVITALGGAPKENIERAFAGKTQQMYFADLFEHYVHHRWITSSLLKNEEKNELLHTLLQEHFGAQEIDHRYHYKAYGDELTEEFRPLRLVDLFESTPGHFAETGLIQFLNHLCPWTYILSSELTFTPEWIEEHQHTVKFFEGKLLDRTRFAQMLKLFMMGQRVVLDRSGLAPELDKRLQIFFMENNLKLQSVNFVTNVTLCELGEGKFIAYEGERLKGISQAAEFWNNLTRFLSFNQLEIKLEPEVFCLWKIRATRPTELNYLDVRRVSLYNPTSYKKQVHIHTQGRFAFMKMIDPSKAQAKSVTHGVEVELLPNGRIALDFGHYEEA